MLFGPGIRGVWAGIATGMVMRINMPTTDGLIATRRIRRRRSPPEVIVLTTFNADEYVLEALRGGASGFLLKDTPPRDIIAAIRAVAAGAPSLSPAVIRRLIDQCRRSRDGAPPGPSRGPSRRPHRSGTGGGVRARARLL
jgi:DNA-binding NarL/FixJ family response regulator